MVHCIYVVSTEWGGSKGGINVFNKSLVEALTRVVSNDVEVNAVAASSTSTHASLGPRHRRLTYDGTTTSLARVIESDLLRRPDRPKTIAILGHDVHTGSHAIGAREILNEKSIHCLAAVFCHMDYSAYQRFKGTVPSVLTQKIEEQRRIVCEADRVYAIGPLLKESFERLRADRQVDTPIQEIIPGFPEALAQQEAPNPSNALKFFFSGRIDRDNDRVKNGRLALRALHDAYSKMSRSNDPRWRQRGTFIAYGFPQGAVDRDWFCENIDRAELGEYLSLDLEEYSEQEVMFKQLCDSHIALMPSIHEGFGLVGWEAICAGIPLICSNQSGLAFFLEACFESNHDLPRESVLTISLSDSDKDVATLSSGIQEAARSYERRRSHARKLADYLSRSFTWDDCALSVANGIGRAPLGSPHWRTRQSESRAAVARRQESGEAEADLRSAVHLAAQGKALTEWSVTCTALNFLSDVGKDQTYASIEHARTQLDAIASGISAAYASDQATWPDLRSAGRFDVAWRFMAAASSVGTSLKAFVESIPSTMMAEIRQDSFLRREMLQYSTRYSSEFGQASEEYAREFFADLLSPSADDHSLQIRFARLEAAYPELTIVAALDEAVNDSYVREREHCRQVKSGQFDLNDLLLNAQGLAATALSIATIDRSMQGRGVDQVFDAWKEHGGLVPEPTWRGDKLLPSALFSATVHPNVLLDFLASLANDEEEALRWAAIDLAFSPALRNRLFRASYSGSIELSVSQLKHRLGQIIDAAISNGDCHPWMLREFLVRFHREHASPVVATIKDRFTALDFPIARQLFGPAPGQEVHSRFKHLHPEVQVSARRLREHLQRILLVLPPISMASDARDVSQTSTPPLGLGMIASRLLALGHDVLLIDCHRDPGMTRVVIESASDFDWVGFNVVLPTIRSVLAMTSQIKRLSNAPVIVVGGPSVNARAFRNAAFDDEERSSWDFEIYDDAEENFEKLLTDIGTQQVGLGVGVAPNNRSQVVIRSQLGIRAEASSSFENVREWSGPLLLDRRIFSACNCQYEPHRTRALDGNAVEAHVVMSRGCDWNCSFCTERRELSGGERRRTIEDVEQELLELARSYQNLRIQFVDDNVLPQLGVLPITDRVNRARALDWSDDFIEALSRISKRSDGSFGWRGIFRVEDFFAFEEAHSCFIDRLASSGCRMLAFGIEHGIEDRRRKMKAGNSASNMEFADLFSRLRSAGIHSKGYFIIGGPKETPESSEETIKFAIESGVSVAYFALYKEFVPAVRSLRSEYPAGKESHQSYSTYDQLDIQWDKVLEDSDNYELEGFISGIDPTCELLDRNEITTVYNELSRLGFRFSDLVKYNDHHSEAPPSSEILSKVNFGDQAQFEGKVASAYLRFYLRRHFVETYKELLAYGY